MAGLLGAINEEDVKSIPYTRYKSLSNFVGQIRIGNINIVLNMWFTMNFAWFYKSVLFV
jgi:hypothetical protein